MQEFNTITNNKNDAFISGRDLLKKLSEIKGDKLSHSDKQWIYFLCKSGKLVFRGEGKDKLYHALSFEKIIPLAKERFSRPIKEEPKPEIVKNNMQVTINISPSTKIILNRLSVNKRSTIHDLVSGIVEQHINDILNNLEIY